MPRRDGQVFIGFKCSSAFRKELERAAGASPLSQYMREAIVEKLRGMGLRVPDSLAEAPSRVGKGGSSKRGEDPTLRTSDSPSAPLPKVRDAKYPTKKQSQKQSQKSRP